MREIMFRGKRTDNGEWTYGYLHYLNLSEPPTAFIGYIDKIQVDPETIGQFTGECDKHKRKIFEGDIVSIGTHFDIVKFELGCFLMSQQAFCYEFTYQDFDKIEVIGNIYDDPVLCEKIGGSNL